MSEKEKNRSQGSLKNVASTVRSAVNYVEEEKLIYPLESLVDVT